MVQSLILPETCGFAKVAAWEVLEATRRTIKRESGESTTTFRSRLAVAQYECYVNVFDDRKENFSIEQKYFHAKLMDLQKKFSRWNSRKIEERTQYVNAFSSTKWAKLPLDQKDEHSLMDCTGCAQRYTSEQSLFSVKCKQHPNPTVESKNLEEARQHIQQACGIITGEMAKNGKPNSTETARALYNEINPVFQYSCNVSLSKALTKVRELRLSPKKSKAFEPLHDIGRHIENVLVELPAHLAAEEASIVSDIVDVSLDKCWQSCLSNNTSLPLQELWIPDENGNMVLSQASTSEVTQTVKDNVLVDDSVESTLSSSSTLSMDMCDHHKLCLRSESA